MHTSVTTLALIYNNDISSDYEDTDATVRTWRERCDTYQMTCKEYEDIGYNPHGNKVLKECTGNKINMALQK